MDPLQRSSQTMPGRGSQNCSAAPPASAKYHVDEASPDTGLSDSLGAVNSAGNQTPQSMRSLSHSLTLKDASKAIEGSTGNFGFHLWDCDIAGGIKSEVFPAADGTLYCSTEDGKLVAIREGRREWEIKLSEGSLTKAAEGLDGTVYVSGKHAVYAVKDGEKKAECPIGEGEESISRPAAGPDGTIYVTTNPGRLYALKNGKIKWSYRPKSFVNKRENSAWCDPTVGPDGTVYAGTAAGRIVALRDGREAWTFKMDKVAVENMTGDDYYNENDRPLGAPVLAADGTLYVGTGGGQVYALNEGKKLWGSRITDYMGAFNVGHDGTVYTQGSSILGTRIEQSLCAVSKGEITWSYHPPDGEHCGISSAGVLPDGRVLAGSLKNSCILHEGKRAGDIFKDPGSSKEGITQKPLVGPQGRFYIVHEGRTIKAYSVEEPPRDSGTDNSSASLVDPSVSDGDNSWLIIDDLRLPIKKQGGG
jgi:outer membrane protein assembly factor BamB